jgi:hypothetical protein
MWRYLPITVRFKAGNESPWKKLDDCDLDGYSIAVRDALGFFIANRRA